MKSRIISFVLAAIMLIGLIPVTAIPAAAANTFVISDECLEMIKEFEGFSAKPYWDYGQWTVGYGTRVPSENLERYKKEGISKEEATELLRDKLSEYGEDVNEFADDFGLTLTQGQFDALLSLSFNCGSNWTKQTSTFRTAVLEGKTGNDFLFAMGQWSTAGGEVQRGLVRRRLIEINMYLNGIYSMDVPENYDYVLYDANGGERDVKVQCYDSELTATPISVPSYEGKTFAGWYTKAEGGEKITVLNADVAGFKLYAHWTEDGVQEPETPTEPETPSEPAEPEKPTEPETPSEPDEPEKPTEPEEPEKPSEPTEPEEQPANGIKVKVTGSNVNIRKGPGTNHARVGTLNKGDELVITATETGSGYTWGQFSGGWVCLLYTNYEAVTSDKPVQPDQGTTETLSGVVVVEDALRIRSQAGTGSSVVGYLRNGDKVEILERKRVSGTEWGRIEKGWICLDYVKLSSGSAQQPAEPETPAKTQTGVITGSNLRIRKGPNTSFEILGYLQIGDKVTITETRTTGTTLWGKISNGWISMDYVKLDQQSEPEVPSVPENNKLTGTITGDYLRIRSGAGTGYEVLGYYFTGDRVTITERKTVGSIEWGKTEKGWISMDYVKLDEVKAEIVTGVVKPGNLLRIRSGAGSGYTVVGYVSEGETVEILEQKTVDGTRWGRTEKGWINLAFVTLSTDEPETPDTTKTGTIIADVLNVRSAPGTGNSVVGVYYYGDTVTILETRTVNGSEWGRTDKGWISMDYVK